MVSDEQLLQSCARGDERALAALHDRHARTAFAFAFRILGSEHDAQDVVVDAFYEVWRSARRFDSRSRVRTWILGIVRHKALDVLRQRGTQHETPMDEVLADSVIDEAPPPFDVLVQRQQHAMLIDCMAQLPAAQRECLQLALLEGMRLSDIAQIQGVPANTVATRIHHAKRKLADCVAAAAGLK